MHISAHSLTWYHISCGKGFVEQESLRSQLFICGSDEEELTQTQSCHKYQSTQKQKEVDTYTVLALCNLCTFMLMNWCNERKSMTTPFLLYRSYILDSEKQFITRNINIHQVFLLTYTDSPSFSTLTTRFSSKSSTSFSTTEFRLDGLFTSKVKFVAASVADK